MEKSYEKILTVLTEFKKYQKTANYIASLNSNREGSYSFTQMETFHTNATNKKKSFSIAIMKELIKNPAILECVDTDALLKELRSLGFTDCLELTTLDHLETQTAYDQACELVHQHIKDIQHFFKIDQSYSRGYSGNHPEFIAESISSSRTQAKQNCTIKLLKLMASNPEILTIQDVSGNNLGMEFARLKLEDCLEVAMSNQEACNQRNEAGLTMEDMANLSMPLWARNTKERELQQ